VLQPVKYVYLIFRIIHADFYIFVCMYRVFDPMGIVIAGGGGGGHYLDRAYW